MSFIIVVVVAASEAQSGRIQRNDLSTHASGSSISLNRVRITHNTQTLPELCHILHVVAASHATLILTLTL